MLQAEIQKLLLPIIEKEGKNYQKNKNVYARKAILGEKIDTHTNDGMESTNTVREASYIIRNQTNAQEEYVISKTKFQKRYDWLHKVDETWGEYSSKGKIRVIELTDNLMDQLAVNDPFYFIASWGEKMIARKGDFMVCPQGQTEIYRIARQEFFETYVLF